MKTAEIRRRFLDYFAARDHEVVPSASLVSPDPSLLFTIAGMVPFIPYLTGRQTAPYQRATSVQKCVRTLDIEEVGKTTRHGTFFQMCGNFSFGDYFKPDAITWAWDFITGPVDKGCLGFDKDRIWVTALEGDETAANLWLNEVGINPERLQFRDRADNYWQTGQPGPGGPCSEIYYDRGPEYGAEGGPVVDEDRYIEIWNLVFMEHQLSEVRSKVDFDIAGDLPNRNIDTGLGLERVAFLLQEKENLYEIDEVFPVITKASELAGVTYGKNPDHDVHLRVVADHVRSGLMLMGDGVTPSNEGRGYVLRRLLRRTIRAMKLLGVETPVLPELLPVSKDLMSVSYPELNTKWDHIQDAAFGEETSFRRTLTSGTAILDDAVTKATSNGTKKIDGSAAFQLHDTYGFPIELTLEIAAEQGVDVDQQGFVTLMQEQRDRAKADARAKKAGSVNTNVYHSVAEKLGRDVEFTGYNGLNDNGRVVEVLVDGEPGTASEGQEIDLFLDRTPFYAESGGQLADRGRIELDNGAIIDVHDAQKPVDGLIVHRATVVSGEVKPGLDAGCAVDPSRRHAISRAHTATHLTHKAIREALGDAATQAGSENSPGKFRFDFHANKSVPSDVLSQLEHKVNVRVAEDLPVTSKVMSQDEALNSGAMALFGEKYGDEVRVISVGDWAVELCGGTHSARSSQIGLVKFLGESSIGSGVRRVEALVGTDAYNFMAREHALVSQLTTMLKVQPDELHSRVETLVADLKAADKELSKVRAAQLLAQAPALVAAAEKVGDITYVKHNAGSLPGVDDLRTLVTDVRGRLGDPAAVVAVAAESNGRPVIVVATNDAARTAGVRAGDLVKVAAGVLGGGGGGKPDMAQGGGQDPTKIDAALAEVANTIRSKTA